MNAIESILNSVALPQFYKAKQLFDRPQITNVQTELSKEIDAVGTLARVTAGQRIAVAVGCPGIANLPEMVKVIISKLRAVGAEPFIVPAMGSLEKTSAQEQQRILESLGITENVIGAPICSTMETVLVGVSPKGVPVFIDRHAYEADGIVLINRIKPHSGFCGNVESGLMKLLTIGLGKQTSAAMCHCYGSLCMSESIAELASFVIQATNFLFGVAVIENAYYETAQIKVLTGQRLYLEEAQLEQDAQALLPKLYFPEIDVLVIDEIGQDSSGSVSDTTVIGRNMASFDAAGLHVGRKVVLDITKSSAGNRFGLASADYTTRRAFGKFKYNNTYPKALPTGSTAGVKIPLVLPNDKLAIQAAIKDSRVAVEKIRLVRVKSTFALEQIYLSTALYQEVGADSRFEIDSQPATFDFDRNGNLF
ncbi:MAG TPA: lactate racemase domain-containing protein [Negativicutes bacterium]|jgi:hypothetical protein